MYKPLYKGIDVIDRHSVTLKLKDARDEDGLPFWQMQAKNKDRPTEGLHENLTVLLQWFAGGGSDSRSCKYCSFDPCGHTIFQGVGR
jgi:hypothetical protein